MKLFITGTDTNAGKTYVSCGILTAFNQAELSTIALKPLASGCQPTAQGLLNDDALILQQHANIHIPYSMVNPFAVESTVAPHISAKRHNIALTAEKIVKKCQQTLEIPADLYLIEGVGGWLTPLNETETMADVALQLDANIILVVGMRLGCLNHALLTSQAIKQKGCRLIGWVANALDPDMLYIDENIDMLKQLIIAPLLQIVPYQGSAMHYGMFSALVRISDK